MKSRNNTLAKNNSGTQHKNQDIYDPDQTLNREFSGGRTPPGQQQIVTPSESQKEKLEVISMHDMED